MLLDGKIALVTGSGGGIGRAIAEVFAREGAHVVGCDLNADGSQETVELVRAAGGEMTAMAPVDLASEAGANAWVSEAVRVYGGIDVLVNNASAIRFGPIASLSVEDWSFTIRNELDLVFLVTRAAWPHLIERGGGSIVNIASISATPRCGVHAEERARRREGRPARPDAAACQRGRPAPDPGQRGEPGDDRDTAHCAVARGTGQPFRRTGRTNPPRPVRHPDDVAYAVLYLASDEAAHVTGANIPVDGGTAALG